MILQEDWNLSLDALRLHAATAPAENRALRGRNLSADWSQIDGRPGFRRGGLASLLPESEDKAKNPNLDYNWHAARRNLPQNDFPFTAKTHHKKPLGCVHFFGGSTNQGFFCKKGVRLSVMKRDGGVRRAGKS